MSPTLGVPMHLGVGWGGFYKAGTATAGYGNLGLAFSQPFELMGRRIGLRSQILAWVRDPTLRKRHDDRANGAAVVPLATIGVSAAY